jgi:predicted small secreted protein
MMMKKKTVMGLLALALTAIATACNPMEYLPGGGLDDYCGGQRSVDCPQ